MSSIAEQPEKRRSSLVEEDFYIDRGKRRAPQDAPHSSSLDLARESMFYSIHEFLESRFQEFGEPFDRDEELFAYSEYKKRFLEHRLTSFFEHNKTQQWFIELLDPIYNSRAVAEHSKLVEFCLSSFKVELDSGALKNVCLDEAPDEPQLDRFQFCSTFLTDLPRFCIRNIPPHLSRSSLIDAVKRITDFLCLSQASEESDGSSTSQYRTAWVYLLAGSNLEDFFAALSSTDNRMRVKDGDSLEVQRVPALQSQKVRSCPEIAGSEERIRRDLDLVQRICTKLNSQHQADDALSGLPSFDQDNLEEAKARLDLLIVFLRRVHHFCFYCGVAAESPDALIQICGSCHIRKLSSTKNHGNLLLLISGSLSQRLGPTSRIEDCWYFAKTARLADAEEARCFQRNGRLDCGMRRGKVSLHTLLQAFQVQAFC